MIRKFLLGGWFVCSIQWAMQAQCNNPMPQINAEQIFCAIDGKTISDLDTSSEDVTWYYQEEGGLPYNDMFVLKTGIYYASNVSGGGCSPRLPVTVKVFGAKPKTSIISNICKNFSSTISFLSVQGAEGSTIEWYDSEFGGTLLAGSTMLEAGVEYWAQQIDNGCVSARSKTLVAFVDPNPPTISDPEQIFCNAQLSTVSSLQAEVDQPGNFIIWYQSETDDVRLDPTDPLVDNKMYWAAQYENGCESVSRASMTVLIDKAQYAGTDSAFEVCEINLVAFNMFDKLGGSPDINGVWSGPSNLGGDYLGTFNPAINVGGIYTYTVSSQYGVCADDEATVTVVINKTDAPTVVNSTQTFCEIEQATIGDLVAIGDDIQWYADASSNVVLDSSELLVNGKDYFATQTNPTTNCESVGRTKVTVSINVTHAPTVTQSTQDFCEIERATIGDLMVVGDNVLWYADANSSAVLPSSVLLEDGKSYFATQRDLTTDCESALRTEVKVIINVTDAPTVVNATQTFCEIEQATISDLAVSGDQIQWYADAISTVALDPTEPLVNGESYFATKINPTTNCESASRTEVTVVIHVTNAPTVVNTTQTFCEIEHATVGDLVATGDQIRWYADAASTVALDPTEPLANGESYFATQTNPTTSCESVLRTEVTVVINVTDAPTVVNATQTFCEIEQATISDLAVSGDQIQWYADAISTVALDPTEPLVNGESYFATKIDPTTNCESASRTEVTVVIYVTDAPTVANTTQTFCEIEQATVGDLAVSGDQIQWYADAASTIALDPTEPLANGESYFATQTNPTTSCESVLRTEVTVVINVIDAPTVANTTQTFCEIEQATISDLAVSGDQIQWYADISSTVALDVTEPLVNGESYFATKIDPTTNCESASRTEVTVVIHVIDAPIVANTTQTFCEIEQATVGDLVVTGDQIQWYADAASTVALDSTEPLVNGESYFATKIDLTTNCESTSRTEVTVVINVTDAPTVANSTQTFCEIEQAAISDLAVSGDQIQWYADAASTVALDPTEPLVNGKSYFATQSNLTTSCESILRTEVTVVINVTNAPAVANTKPAFCEIEQATVGNLVATGDQIQWYADATSTVALDSTEPLVNGKSYFATQSSPATNCESVLRTEVTVVIHVTDAPIVVNTTQTFCEIEQATIADLDVTGNDIKWYADETSMVPLDLTELITDGEDYFASETNETTHCESASRVKVITVISETPEAPVVINKDQFFCESSFAVLSDLEIQGEGIKWYANETSTIELDNNELLVNNTSYFASQTSSLTGCESLDRTEISVELVAVSVPVLEQGGDAFCSIDNPALLLLNNKVSVESGAAVVWYDSPTGENMLDLDEILVHDQSYYAVAIGPNGCESIDALEVVVNLKDCDEDRIKFFDGFSPNNDGVNDTFKVLNIEYFYPDYEIEYFNRWGSLIYKGNATKPSWNGRLQGDGKLMPVGVYYYVLKFNKNNKKPKQGRLYLGR